MLKLTNVSVLIVLSVLVECVVCANILLVGGLPSRSHHIFNRALTFSLAERGHNVTVVEPDEETEKHENFHHILIEGVYDGLYQTFDINSMLTMTAFRAAYECWEFAELVCKFYFQSKGLRQLMDYPKDFKFDLIIFDNTFGECLYPFIDRFNKPPVVGITAFLLPPYLGNAMGNHLYSSYYPHHTLQLTNRMAFLERVYSFLVTHGDTLYRNYVFVHRQHENMKKYFGEDVRNFVEYERNISLLLSNTDPILDNPLPLPPNIIPVGGMHIKPVKPLPKDFQKIIDEAEHGVILFSLGTNIKAHQLGAKMRDEFLGAFRKLKETVIWKYEVEIPNLPKNVVVDEWLPQSAILANPKCKLFITHGGGLSTQESIFHGVPMVGIPGFVDQHKNVEGFVKKGFGLRLDFGNIERENMYGVVKEVLDNPKYRNKIKEASKKYRDQPQTPLERAIFWTEYVLRNKGAEHLSLPARDMYFYQTSNLDVVSFLIFVLSIIVFILYKCVVLICCSSKQQKMKRH